MLLADEAGDQLDGSSFDSTEVHLIVLTLHIQLLLRDSRFCHAPDPGQVHNPRSREELLAWVHHIGCSSNWGCCRSTHQGHLLSWRALIWVLL